MRLFSLRQSEVGKGPGAVRCARATGLAAVLVILAASGLAAGCGGGEPDLLNVRGRTLELHYEPAEITKGVVYTTAKGRHFQIRTADPSTRIAVMKVIIVNRGITHVPMRIDSDAADIGNRRKGERFKALNPLDDFVREEIDSVDAEEGDPEEGTKFISLLWGDVVLNKGTQAAGWLVFEVPVGLQLDTLWWNQSDEILARF